MKKQTFNPLPKTGGYYRSPVGRCEIGKFLNGIIYRELRCPNGENEYGVTPLAYIPHGKTRYRCPCGEIHAAPKTRIYDRAVRLTAGGYDQGGAYWGTGRPLRCKYAADGSFRHFYRTR